MKLYVLIAALFFVSSVNAFNGIERHSEDSRRAKSHSWQKILKGSSNLKVDYRSVIHPEGASLFNVCIYDQNNFKVLKPKPKCVKYKEIEVDIPRSGGDTEIKRYCVKRKKVEFELVSNLYNKCVLEETIIIDEHRPRKDQIYKTVCVERKMMLLPTVQVADIYTQRREERFQFTKTYTVPTCRELGHADNEI